MKLAFTGDICFTGIFEEKLKQGQEIFAPALLDLLRQQDFVVGNFEGAATSSENFTKEPALKNPAEAVKYLAERNIRILDLANNHLFDFGVDGFEETQELAQQHGVKTFGAGRNLKQASQPLYLDKDGITVALIGCAHTEGMMATNEGPGVFGTEAIVLLKNKIDVAKKVAQHVIVVYHGGEEYTLYPMPQRRALFQHIAGLGASAVVGHHPHVVQGVEEHNGVPLFYSLGNFIFDYPGHRKMDYTGSSTVLTFNITHQNIEYKLKPLKIMFETGMVGEAGEEELQHLQQLNDFTDYRQKWNAEAYRVWHQKRQQHIVSATGEGEGLPQKNFTNRMVGFIEKMRHPTYRSIAVGALSHYFKKRLP